MQSTARQLDRATDPRVTSLELRYLPLPCFPDQMHRLAHLKSIDIRGAGLSELPHSINELTQLDVLRLSENPIRSLPESISQLHQLRELSITFCPELTALPEHLAVRNASGQREGLVNLRTLQLSNTGIRSLPSSIRYLKDLETIDLSRSPITSLPSEIHQLPLLEELDLQGCTALRTLPPIGQRGSDLKSLNLRNCSALRTLPDDIGQLKSLEVLDLRGCDQLVNLPTSLSELPESCTIKISPLLQNKLDSILALRPTAKLSGALSKIEDTAYALMNAVLNDRNPFLEGAPVYTGGEQSPETSAEHGKAPAVRTRLGDVPAIKTMLEESRSYIFSDLLVKLVGPHPEARNNTPAALAAYENDLTNWKVDLSAHLGMLNPDGTPRYHEGQELNVENMTKVVQMWRTRERIVSANPAYRRLFKEIPLHIPAETQHNSDDESTDDN